MIHWLNFFLPLRQLSVSASPCRSVLLTFELVSPFDRQHILDVNCGTSSWLIRTQMDRLAIEGLNKWCGVHAARVAYQSVSSVDLAA